MFRLLVMLFPALLIAMTACQTNSESDADAGVSPATQQPIDPPKPLIVDDNSVKVDPNETINSDFGRGLVSNDFVNGEKINHNFKAVYFAYDSALIRREETSKLKMLAGFLESNPRLFLIIKGHCDERGSAEYNRALSERRALAVKEFVEQSSSGLSPRINTIGYGEEKLADPGSSELAHAKNRRAEFLIISQR